MGKTAYVGNMSHDITDAKLRELFSAYGEVEEVRVVTDNYTGRPRGFAFVDMAAEEATQATISELNRQTVGDRPLKVAEARPRRQRDPDRRVYVSSRGW